MLASQVIDNGYHDSRNMVGGLDVPSPHSLAGVVKRYLGKELSTSQRKKFLQQSFIGLKGTEQLTQEQIDYAGEDVEYLYPVYLEQQKYIKERGLEKIIKLENRLTPVLVKMEFNGCLIDKAKHKENVKSWGKELDVIEERLDQAVSDLAKEHPQIQGGRFTNIRKKESFTQLDMFGGDGYVVKNLNVFNVNYSSPTQINDLFTRLNCPKPVDDLGKVSYGENSIKTYINNNPSSILSPFLTILLDYREYSKLLGTYGEKLFDMLDKNGRLRTHYAQCWTDTGRLASSEVLKGELGMNLANIPKRSDIRSIFVPDPGYSFVDSDMSGQEVLIAGDFSKEPVIMKAFKEGFDHHSFLASLSYSIIFNRDFKVENGDKEVEIDGFKYNHKWLRHDHKSCLFAKFYGGGAMRVQNVLNKYIVNHWPPEKRFDIADQISKALNAALPTLTKYLRSQVDFCKKHGYVVANKLGRRRYFDTPDTAYGEIMNFPIQATGADSIKIALIKLDEWITTKAKELKVQETEFGFIVMSIYDQNLICLNDKYLEYASDVPKIMGEAISYFLEDLKGSSDLQIKKHWSK